MKRILKWIVRVVFVLLLLAFLFVFVAYWRSTNDCDRYNTAPTNAMKAIVYCDYGVANLKLADIEKPVPNDDQLLVRVRAASVNPLDWHYVEGTPTDADLGRRAETHLATITATGNFILFHAIRRTLGIVRSTPR